MVWVFLKIFFLMSSMVSALRYGSGVGLRRISSKLQLPSTRIRSFRASPATMLSKRPDFNAELDSKYFEFQKLEQNIYSWWESKGYFKPSSNKRAKPYVIPMPPPNVTGYLHMGHAIFIALQDIMARFYRMKGYSTLWLPGTDHAGIATQLLVEKSLAAEGQSRKSLGRDKFLEKVWQWKAEKGGYITQQMRRLGASADWSREKFTLDTDMNEAVTEAFIKLFDKGLIYRGSYMVNWSPNLQTAVSDLEVEYSEEEGKLYHFKYELASGKGFIPVATTRPETILGDTAVCVHPDDDRYRQYIGQLVKVPILGREIPVIADEYVDREFGTGALKITPAHDVNDYELGKKHNLPMINVMNKDATINHVGTARYEGLDRFVCRQKLWADMAEVGLVLKEEKHAQRIPRSQRGGEVIEPMISAQWFVKMDGMAKKAVDAVKTKELQIIPERFEKTWFNWLDNIHDWCISRQLWWGHRIPVYYITAVDGIAAASPADLAMSSGAQFVVAKSLEDARQQAQALYPNAKDILLSQDEDVLDTWFSSGLWPFATVGWPNVAHADYQRFYPASVLETGYDILFFWVARMVTLGIELTDQVPFHTIYMHGLVRDAQGRKMSKTTGNVIDPIDTLEQFGSDALRYSLVTGSTPGQDVPLSLERVESNRNFVNKLWNAGKYIQNCLSTTSAAGTSLDRFQVTGLMSEAEIQGLQLPERYIVSQCHALVALVTSQLEAYQFGEAGRAISNFLWDEVADWYIEVSKPHMRSENPQIREQTVRVLTYVWDVALRLLHPYMPYITETLWQHLPHTGESIMTAPWPDFVDSNHPSSSAALFVDEEALRSFGKFQSLVRAIRNARAEFNVDVSKKISMQVRASPAMLAYLQAEEKALSMMCRIEDGQLTFLPWVADESSSSSTAKDAVHLIVSEDLEAFLPQSGLMDREKEIQRLHKQAEKLRKDIGVYEGRLNNAAFVAKAPPSLVQEVQGKMSDLQQQLTTVLNSLEHLTASDL